MKEAGRGTIGVFTGIVDPLLESLKAYWPDDVERKELAKAVKSDCVNDAYHLYLLMYFSFRSPLISGLLFARANRRVKSKFNPLKEVLHFMLSCNYMQLTVLIQHHF